MASWKEILQFDSPVAAMPKPVGQTFENPLDKITGYLKDAKNAQRQNLVDRSNQAKFDEEADTRRVNKELADSFKANAPKDAEDVIERMISVNARLGKTAEVARLMAQREDAKAKREQKMAEMDQKKQVGQRQVEANAMKMALKDPDGALRMIDSPMFSSIAGNAEGLRAIAADRKAAKEGKAEKTFPAFILREQQSGDPARVAAAMDLYNRYSEIAQANKIEAMQFGLQNQMQLKQFDVGNRQPRLILAPDGKTVVNLDEVAGTGVGSPTPAPTQMPTAPTMPLPPMPPAAGEGGFTAPPPAPSLQGGFTDVTPLPNPATSAASPAVQNDMQGQNRPGVYDTGLPGKAAKEGPIPKSNDPYVWGKDWLKEPIVKEYKLSEVTAANAQAMQDLAKKNGYDLNVAQHTLMYKYIQALDHSVVRPSEIEAFRNLIGKYSEEGIVNYVRGAMYGQPMPKDIFDAMISSLSEMQSHLGNKYEAKKKEWGQLMLDRGMKPADLDYVFKEKYTPEPTAASEPAPAVARGTKGFVGAASRKLLGLE